MSDHAEDYLIQPGDEPGDVHHSEGQEAHGMEPGDAHSEGQEAHGMEPGDVHHSEDPLTDWLEPGDMCELELGPTAPAAPAGFRSPVKTVVSPCLTGHDGDDGDDEAEAEEPRTLPDASPRKRRKTGTTKRIPFRSAERSGHHTVSPFARAARGGWTFSRLLDVRLLDVGQPADRTLMSTMSLCVIGGLSRWLDV